MERIYIEEKTITRQDFTTTALAKGEYEKCSFLNCNFLSSDLSGISFSECVFTGCNLSMVVLTKTGFKDVKFKDCKMLGLHFEHCSDFLFAVYFENCILNLSSFYKVKIKKTKFKNSSLQEVDFTEADASQALFENCDLLRAIFGQTVLEKADLRTSFNYSIDPEMNRIKKAKFSLAAVVGLLDKYDIDIQ